MKQIATTVHEGINKYSKREGTDSIISLSTSSSTSSSLPSRETLNRSSLDLILTNRGVQLYGTWSKTKLLTFLTDRLKQCIHVHRNFPYDAINNERLQMTISSGLYSTSVLKKLEENGMSMYSILKAMKLGLISLNCCELNCFKDFNVVSYILEFKEMWSKKFNDELILNLKPMGFTESECWNIIVHGIMFQNLNILYRLTLSGIDVPGILNWHSVINLTSPEIIQFLKHIGIAKDIIQLVKKYGITEETEQMLIDIGFDEMKEQLSNMEEVVCDYKLTVMESSTSSLEKLQDTCKTTDLKSTSSSTDTSNYFQQYACLCHLLAENKTVAELTAQRNDYLRQNIMVPLSWAMAKTLEFKPTDPLHYTAYQLLRWAHNVSETEKNALQQLIALATIEMDRKLTEKIRLEEEEELIRNLNEKNTKNTVCKDSKQFEKYARKSLKKYETCEFPEMCSSCKINVSNTSV
nr:uncharacterized protein LOC117606624 [Osmia lignaria]